MRQRRGVTLWLAGRSQPAIIRSVAPSANYLLLIDTCGVAGTLALAGIGPEAPVLGEATLPGRSTSERLLPAIQDLLNGHGLALEALGGIGIVSGPGSFTGIRVGLSAAKGLCEVLSIPLIAVSRLAVMARKSTFAGDVLAVLDAGRGEFYGGRYGNGERVREALVSREQVLALAEEPPGLRLVACEDVVLGAFEAGLVERVGEPTAADVLPEVWARFGRGEFNDVAAVDANYVRRTDLEIFAKQVRRGVAEV